MGGRKRRKQPYFAGFRKGHTGDSESLGAGFGGYLPSSAIPDRLHLRVSRVRFLTALSWDQFSQLVDVPFRH